MKELKEYIDARLKSNHFINHIGLTLHKLDKGEAEIGINVEEFHLQQNGFLHGGVTATLADVATGIAAYTCCPEGKNVVTADLKISYLNPGTSKKVKAIGKVTKAGLLIFFCECEVFDIVEGEEDKLIAKATAIMVAVDIPLRNEISQRNE
jgi:uncharacterized protein (TIGR00369 family)